MLCASYPQGARCLASPPAPELTHLSYQQHLSVLASSHHVSPLPHPLPFLAHFHLAANPLLSNLVLLHPFTKEYSDFFFQTQSKFHNSSASNHSVFPSHILRALGSTSFYFLSCPCAFQLLFYIGCCSLPVVPG